MEYLSAISFAVSAVVAVAVVRMLHVFAQLAPHIDRLQHDVRRLLEPKQDAAAPPPPPPPPRPAYTPPMPPTTSGANLTAPQQLFGPTIDRALGIDEIEKRIRERFDGTAGSVEQAVQAAADAQATAKQATRMLEAEVARRTEVVAELRQTLGGAVDRLSSVVQTMLQQQHAAQRAAPGSQQVQPPAA